MRHDQRPGRSRRPRPHVEELWHSWVERFMNSKYVGVSVGISLGLCFGAALGTALHNLGWSSSAIGVGIALGGANLNKSPEHWSLRWFLAGVNFVAICYDFRCVWASLGRDELISNRQACKCVRQKPNTRFKRGKS